MYPSNVDNFWKFGIKVQTGETVRLAGYKINLPFKTGNNWENLTKLAFCVIVKKITEKLHYDYEP